jgi:hypothetical protein
MKRAWAPSAISFAACDRRRNHRSAESRPNLTPSYVGMGKPLLCSRILESSLTLKSLALSRSAAQPLSRSARSVATWKTKMPLQDSDSLRQLIGTLPGSLLAPDEAGTIQFASVGSQALFYRPFDQWVGLPIQDIIPGFDPTKVWPRKQADGVAVQMVDGHHESDRVPVTFVMPIIGSP